MLCSNAQVDIWAGSSVPKTALILASMLVIVALILSADEGSAAEEELQITWVDEDHVREYDVHMMHTFNFTVEYIGPQPSVWVTYEGDVYIPGIMLFVGGEEDIDIRDLEYRYSPGNRYNATVYIMTSSYALNDTHWINLTMYIDDDTEVDNAFPFGIIMRQFADFEIEIWNPPPNGEFTAIPPATTTIRFTLYNLGNGYDSFLITAEWLGIDPQWDFTIESGVNASGYTPWLPPDIDREHPHYIDVKVFPLVAMRAHWTDTLTVTAHSMFDPSINTTPALAKFTSLQYYGFTIDAPVTHIELDRPKAQVEFIINIHNTGNGWDTFTIKPVWDTELNPGFIASPKPRTIDIDSNATERVMFYVVVPDNVPKKTYFFTAEIESSSFELQPRSIHFYIEVGQYYSIQMSAEIEMQSTIPGGNLEYDVTVRNTGNGLDSIVLLKAEGLPSSWLVYTQPSEVTLLQNQEATVSVVVVVPTKFEEAPIGCHDMTIRALSTRGNASAELSLSVLVDPYHDIQWLYDNNAPHGIRRFNPYEQSWIIYTFEIKNLGNIMDEVGFNGSSSSPLVSFTFAPDRTVLETGDSRIVGVRVEVPLDIPPGQYTCNISARSMLSDEMVLRVLVFDFGIDNVDARIPPIPTFIDRNVGDVVRGKLTVQQMTNMSFKIKIENNGTVPTGPVLLRVYDNHYVDGKKVRWNFFNFSTPSIAVNDRYIAGERPFSEYNPPIFWWANVSGNHTLEFRIFLDHQSETDNDVAYIEFYVEARPALEQAPAEWFGNVSGIIVALALIAVVATVVVFGVRMKIRQIKYG